MAEGPTGSRFTIPKADAIAQMAAGLLTDDAIGIDRAGWVLHWEDDSAASARRMDRWKLYARMIDGIEP